MGWGNCYLKIWFDKKIFYLWLRLYGKAFETSYLLELSYSSSLYLVDSWHSVVYKGEKYWKKHCNNKFLIINVVSWQCQGYFMMLESGRSQGWRIHLIISWNVLCWHRLVVNSQFCGSYNIKNLIHFSFSQKNLISKTWYFLGFFQKTWYLTKS